MNHKLKVGFIIGFSLILNLSFSQTILQELSKDRRFKKDKEMLFEISELFQKVNDSLKIDFNYTDTLFIIRGLDMQSRIGYGYVWNGILKTHYSDNKKWRNYKLISTNPKIEIITDKVSWYEFNDLIPMIERWDTVGIKNYVNDCGEVLGGIYRWVIIRFVKLDSNYNLDLIWVREFGMYKKSKTKIDRNDSR